MKIISWNVNGIRAIRSKDVCKNLDNLKPDIICFQETKVGDSDIAKNLSKEGFFSYWAFARKKGYSGVVTYSKKKPLAVIEGLGEDKFDSEGRVIILEFDSFYLVNAYFPNSQAKLARIDYKLDFNDTILKFMKELGKPVILCGDLNVAHTEIDLKNPKTNTMNPGFYIKERDWFTKLLDSGFVDTFRMFNKDAGNYTWWSYRFNARVRNIGWRIDYFIVSDTLNENIVEANIDSDTLGSDHCPIVLDLDL